MIQRILVCCAASILSGCVSFTAINPGESNVSGLSVATKSAWNQAPSQMLRSYRPDTKIWTQNGLLLDRIMIIPAVPTGEPILRQLSTSQALPKFDADMLPNEIEELVESSILKLYGEGKASVEASKLRPYRFGSDKGIMFNLDVHVSGGPEYKGVTGAMIVNEKLYMMVYLAALPHYYDKYVDEATEIIKGVRVSGP